MKPKAAPYSKYFFWVLFIAIYLPILGLLLQAFLIKNNESFVLTLNWFTSIFADENLLQALLNSFLLAIACSILSVALGSSFSIGFQKLTKKEILLSSSLVQIALVFPEIVFALSLLFWFFILQIPLGIITVLIAHLTFTLPFSIKTIQGRMALIDPMLNEAAYDLGATHAQTIKKIILPLLKPALFGAFITSFLLSFDDFLITFFVNGVEFKTLPVLLYTSMKMGLTPKLAALAIVMFVINAFMVWLLQLTEK